MTTNAEIDYLLERWDQTEPQMQRAIVAEFAKRLAAIQTKLQEIVCVEGEDVGLVMLSHESPTEWDAELGISVYVHEHFSELGDALIDLWKISIGKAD